MSDLVKGKRLLRFISLRQPRESSMIKLLVPILITACLTACGGGGSDSPGSAPVSAAPAPAATAPAVVFATPPSASGSMTISSRQVNQNAHGANMSINFTGMTDLHIGGDLNRLWIGAAQTGGRRHRGRRVEYPGF